MNQSGKMHKRVNPKLPRLANAFCSTISCIGGKIHPFCFGVLTGEKAFALENILSFIQSAMYKTMHIAPIN